MDERTGGLDEVKQDEWENASRHLGPAVIALAIIPLLSGAALFGVFGLVAFALRMLWTARARAAENVQPGQDPAAPDPLMVVPVVADSERRRIARDLHDGLQVQLVLLGLEAQQMLANADGPNAARVTALRQGIDRAAATLREVVCGLMPPLLAERGLEAALEDLFDRLPLACRSEVALTDGVLPPVVESTAYFIVAEAANNAVKNDRAQWLEVVIEVVDEDLVLHVKNDGAGTACASGGGSFVTLGERARLLGGWLQVDSSSDRGTHVTATLPCGSRLPRGALAHQPSFDLN